MVPELDHSLNSLQTNGWAERTLLRCLAVTKEGRIRSQAAGMQDVHGKLKAVARKPDGEAPEDESVYMTGNRAFHKLHEKGLVKDVETASDLGEDRYTVEEGYTPDDGRRTEWVLTQMGVSEVQRLNELYQQELANLQRRFGRWE